MYRQNAIKTWAREDRPREKLRSKGRQNLTTAELIAILLGNGYRSVSALDLARTLLKECNNDINALAQFSVEELVNIKGIGPAKAVKLVASFELSRRRGPLSNKKQITSSQDAFEVLQPGFMDLGHEVFKLILLNRNNRILKTETISEGGISGTVVDPKLVFKSALDVKASSVILCHNHPSGNLKPSKADTLLTEKLVNAGKLLDISVLDHLIIHNENYFSMLDEGLI